MLIAAILVCTLALHMPIGFVAVSHGLLLAFVNIKEHKTFIGGASWSTVPLVAGMITYVSMLQHVGVIDTLAEMALALGAPLLIALVLCYVIGVGSPFATSTALLTAFIPIAAAAGRQLTERLRHRRGPGHCGHRGLMMYAGGMSGVHHEPTVGMKRLRLPNSPKPSGFLYCSRTSN